MSCGEFLDMVKLSMKERHRLLSMLDRDQAQRTENNMRKTLRQAYRAATAPMVVIQPGGSVSAYLVVTRNLSAGGIAVIHGGYIHAGTECRLMLGTIDGEKVVVPGLVRRCRHIKGNLHEIGVEFLKAVAPEDFVPTTVEDADAARLAQKPEGGIAGEAA